jgi:DNA-directed RNA polymerase subunit beta'
MSQAQKRQLKSLSDVLKGKQGLFRQNLLGKRVDYSGRSVIVVGPNLHLNQCGLPKHMALELFRPFVISKILDRELAFNIRGAGKLIDEKVPEVWAILEDVTKDKYVMLNRAPTLHRLGIQAFQPVLIEGNAIQVHPLVCTAFNADFDGDQMAVHVPLSEHAQWEARELIASNKNLLGPGSGDVIANPKLDIVLGTYWMTKIVDGDKGEGKYFPTPNAAITAYDFGEVGFRAKVKVLATDTPKYAEFEGQIFETSVGRLLFNSVLPSDFAYVNKQIVNKELARIVDDLINIYGLDRTPAILDKIKAFGYKYVTMSGITWGIDDVKVPEEKTEIVANARKHADDIQDQFLEGLLSEEERYRKTIEIWQGVRSDIEKVMPATLDPNGPVHDMLTSGARGSMNAIVQMGGMKGLIINTQGRTIDFPVIPSNKEGLSPIEYFVSTHGSRKGLVDTALNTAKAGYLTRRLVDVAQDAIISEEDCGDTDGRLVHAVQDESSVTVPLAKRVRGRVLAKALKDPDGNALFPKGHLVSKRDAQSIEDAHVQEVWIRNPMSCKARSGICRHCYGLDMGRNKLVQHGEAVGIVAAQAIGEPGTQLTMRTFHQGGVAAIGGDITTGLPRVEEIFERRSPKNAAVIAKSDGTVTDITTTEKEKIITVLPAAGTAKSKKNAAVEYSTSIRRMPLVKVGAEVKKGDFLTDGSADISEVLKLADRERAEEYIISEVLKIYELQGASITPKHVEVIVRQMFSRFKIKNGGDTRFTPNQVVEKVVLDEENEKVVAEGGEPAEATQLVLGISEVSLSTRSWLSAASFQHTTRILIDAAVGGKVDEMRGLKENVIIGRLIPAGTGLRDISEMVDSADEGAEE